MEKEKINAIRRYLRQNGIKYYDVQAELIDHFATAVEKEDRENPSITFKVALLKTHRDFGGREGFRKYVQKAQENVDKKTWLLMGRTLLKFLTWPYFLLTAILHLGWWFLLDHGIVGTGYTSYYLIFLGAFLLAFIINEVYLRKIHWYLPRQGNRSLALICYFLFYIPSIGLNNIAEPNLFLVAGYFSFLSVFTICMTMVPRIMTREVQNIYKFG